MTAIAKQADAKSRTAPQTGIGWLGIVRMGTVQAAIGAMVMLATSLFNRVMVVEYSVAAAIPAALVAWHYAVQITRPLWGYKSDQSRSRTPWIVAGLSILACGSVLAVDVTIMMADPGIGTALLAVLSFTMIGFGVGMSGTALLALLASRVSTARKPAAAAISWTMMIAGIVIAAGLSGAFLDPFSEPRLAIVTSIVVLVAFCAAMLALRNLERDNPPVAQQSAKHDQQSFPDALREIWKDGEARRFTFFVFISMLAYSMQDLIMEPFAGFLFAMTPGESTQLSSLQHSGILVGMLVAGLGGSLYAKRFGANLKLWIVVGCVGSAIMLGGLSFAATQGVAWPLKANVFGLGMMNGVFAVAAVGAMLGLASRGRGSAEGARMGVWGASQAIAFGLGGLTGAVLVDQLRAFTGQDAAAFQIVFSIEAILFVAAALVATGTTLVRPTQKEEAFA
ncbi:BCD family MFS transporter [Qipengyuania sp. DGS5-3]|uniref:BCD family MFS transporter n=1 Tax=Qipengyuania sp. DGS5-3 TaxID=3349632 RepID=UPI0036D2A457